jgi:hypothetical protein
MIEDGKSLTKSYPRWWKNILAPEAGREYTDSNGVKYKLEKPRTCSKGQGSELGEAHRSRAEFSTDNAVNVWGDEYDEYGKLRRKDEYGKIRFHLVMSQDVPDEESERTGTNEKHCKFRSQFWNGKKKECRKKGVAMPLCVMRGVWFANICSTCCCKPTADGRRVAARNFKRSELVMAKKDEGCAAWFGSIDAWINALAGLLERWANLVLWSNSCSAPILKVPKIDA